MAYINKRQVNTMIERLTLRKYLAGHEPNEIFFVDDRPENVAGAREAGFESVLYTDVPQFVTDLRKHGFRFNY